MPADDGGAAVTGRKRFSQGIILMLWYYILKVYKSLLLLTCTGFRWAGKCRGFAAGLHFKPYTWSINNVTSRNSVFWGTHVIKINDSFLQTKTLIFKHAARLFVDVWTNLPTAGATFHVALPLFTNYNGAFSPVCIWKRSVWRTTSLLLC